MNPALSRARFHFGGSLTPIVRTLLWINGLAWLFLTLASQRAFSGGPFAGLSVSSIAAWYLGLVPHSVLHDRAFWQPITYMFMHVSFGHCFWNMLALWMFGPEIERFWGSRTFLRYFLFTGISGAVAAVLWEPSSVAPTLGASGAIFGLFIAYGFLFPNREVLLMFIVPIKVKYFVAGLSLLTMVWLLSETQDSVSHIAHFGGLVFGFLWFLWYRAGINFKDIWRNFQKRRLRRRLRVVKNRSEDDQKTSSQPTIH